VTTLSLFERVVIWGGGGAGIVEANLFVNAKVGLTNDARGRSIADIMSALAVSLDDVSGRQYQVYEMYVLDDGSREIKGID
jgi:hypothetical protein